jgi:hypothetical protein
MASRATQTVTAETDITITVKQKARLLKQLEAYTNLKTELKDLEEAVRLIVADIELQRETIGATAFEIEGYKITRVDGQVTRKLDQKKLLAQGVTLAMIEAATDVTPKKPYTLVNRIGHD